MSEAKDPKIKLFGKTIKLPDNPPTEAEAAGGDTCGAGPPWSSDAAGDDSSVQGRTCLTNSLPEESNLDKGAEEQEPEKELLEGDPSDRTKKHGFQYLMPDDLPDSNAITATSENSNAQLVDNEAAPAKTSKTEEEQSETSNSQEKTPKKPDKILPCPRCNSMDTKFCYFNNYNVNQPRHFCKNCQRYWTAGGTMRNVPVGAGRRKNKNSANHYRHITVPGAFQTVRADIPNGIQCPSLNPNGTALTFGSDTPLCESMASVLNIAEKTMQNCSRNGFHQPEDLRITVSNRSRDNGDDQSNGSLQTAGTSNDEARKSGLPEIVLPNSPNFSQVPCFPGGPWPYPWNSVQWSPPVPPPGLCPPGFPMPFYPAGTYWGCNLPDTWNAPWITPPTTSQNHAPPTSGPNSPTLGKHSRDDNRSLGNEEEEPKKESNPEKCLWVPKTLRIDDPGEAAKSSIWATLGIKNEQTDPVAGGSLFKAFQSKGGEKSPASETSTVLQANPAAMSRSLNFRESS